MGVVLTCMVVVLVWYWYGTGMVLVWYWYGIGMVLDVYGIGVWSGIGTY